MIPFFLGSLSALASGLALLKLMPPRTFFWGRVLHLLIALVMFYVDLIYLLVIAGVLMPSNYARFVYPVSVLILSPAWVILLTQTITYKRLWK